MARRWICATWLAWAAASLCGPQAQAQDLAAGRDVRLRVMATSVPVRAGPGGSFREVGRIGQGQVYAAIDRSPEGAWYRIRLARGVTGWVLSELVWPYEIVDEGAAAQAQGWLQRHVLGSSRLAEGAVHLSVCGGAMDSDGLFAVRLGVQPNRHWMIEALVSQSVGHLGSLLTYGAEVLVAIGPWRTVVPFGAVGAGAATTLPHREGRLFSESTRPMVTAGGGLLLALHSAFTLRFDGRQVLAFAADDVWTALTLSGGLMLTF
jgi:hypothetical protein